MPDVTDSGRRTSFPNIWVESMKVEKPPFDEQGVIQEFVGRGVVSEFEVPKKAADVSKDTVGQLLDSVEESIGPLRDTFRLKYRLVVRVPMGNPFTKRGVRLRARAFVRMKNPFEPDLIEVSPVQQAGGLFENMKGDFYKVSVTVTK